MSDLYRQIVTPVGADIYRIASTEQILSHPVVVAAIEAARSDIPRHIRIALSQIERAAEAHDLSRLGTVNEDLQPLVDAFVGWVMAARQQERARIVALIRTQATQQCPCCCESFESLSDTIEKETTDA